MKIAGEPPHIKQNRLTYVINCFKFDFLGLVIAVCSGSTFEKKNWQLK